MAVGSKHRRAILGASPPSGEYEDEPSPLLPRPRSPLFAGENTYEREDVESGLLFLALSHPILDDVRPQLLGLIARRPDFSVILSKEPALVYLILREVDLFRDILSTPDILEQIYESDEDSIVALLYRLLSGDSPSPPPDGPPVDVAEYINYDRLAREIVNEVGFISLGEGVRQKALTFIRTALKPLGSIPVNGYIDYEGLAKELVTATGDGLHTLIELIKDFIRRILLDLQGPPSTPY